MQASLKVADFFSVHKLVSVKQLFKHRAHYGHKEGCLNPYMAPYIYGTRLGVSIIDLNQTVNKFREALNVAAHIANRGGIIMFASNHKEVSDFISLRNLTSLRNFRLDRSLSKRQWLVASTHIADRTTLKRSLIQKPFSEKL